MQIVDRKNTGEIELFAEDLEEIKLLRDMWNNGIHRQAFDPGRGKDYAALIISSKLLGEEIEE